MIVGVASIPAFGSGGDLPIGTNLDRLRLVFFLLTVATRKFSRGQKVKQGTHDVILLLVQSKLDNMANIISQTVHKGDISPTEFHKVLQEKEKCRKLKADIRN